MTLIPNDLSLLSRCDTLPEEMVHATKSVMSQVNATYTTRTRVLSKAKESGTGVLLTFPWLTLSMNGQMPFHRTDLDIKTCERALRCGDSQDYP